MIVMQTTEYGGDVFLFDVFFTHIQTGSLYPGRDVQLVGL